MLDAIGTAHGQAMNGAQTAALGMSRCLDTASAGSEYIRWPYSSVFQNSGAGGIAAWIYYDGVTHSLSLVQIVRTNSGSGWGVALIVNASGYPVLLLVRSGALKPLTGTDQLAVGWNYVAAHWTTSAQYLHLYTGGGDYHYSLASSGSIRYGNAYTTVGTNVGMAEYYDARIDEIALWNASLTEATFDALAYWYPATGTGTLSGTGLTAKAPTVVSWTATEGASYGEVSKVELLDASLGWTQVGGDNPTSPISVSGITLAADASVRVTLTPKADAIRGETPTLADLTLTYPDAATGRPWLPTVLSSGRYA